MSEQKKMIGDMAYRLEVYLKGEKAAASWHLGFGLAMPLLGGGILVLSGLPFWRGLGWTLILTAALQGWTGWDNRRGWRRLAVRLPSLLQQAPQAFAREETDRMQLVLPHHQRLRAAILGLLILGIILTLIGGVLSSLPFTLGLGTGCCLQGATLLVLTIAGHWRNELYSYEVKSFGEQYPRS